MRARLAPACLLFGAFACATARVQPAGEAGLYGDARRVVTRAEGVTLTATARRWRSPPQRVSIQHTPLWVEIELDAERAEPLRFRFDGFELREAAAGPGEADAELRVVSASAPERVIADIGGSMPESAVVRSQGLRAATLWPGQRARGYLFFRRRFSAETAGRELVLRATFLDAAGERPVAVLELPLELEP